MNRTTKHRRLSDGARGAFVLIELIAAAAMLAVLTFLIAQLLVARHGVDRASRQRELAIGEVANLLERVTALPWEAITQEATSSWQLSGDAHARIREPELSIDIREAVVEGESGPAIDEKRIAVSLSWLRRDGTRVAPVELIAWVYRPSARGSHTESAEESP